MLSLSLSLSLSSRLLLNGDLKKNDAEKEDDIYCPLLIFSVQIVMMNEK